MHAIMLGGNSDIGKQIARRLIRDEWRLTTTYRKARPTEIEKDSPFPDSCCVQYVHMDLPSMIYPVSTASWDLFISCVGTLEPIGPFESYRESPLNAMAINLVWPLRELAKILKQRNANASIVFFSGANTNSAKPNYFAYSIAKIATIKAMELLDAELQDCKCFVLGPGYIPTKMHEQITRAGLKPEAKLKGASFEDVYDCIMWAHGQPKSVIGGRNIAVHTDDWRNPAFAEQLAADAETYKLRRMTNGQ